MVFEHIWSTSEWNLHMSERIVEIRNLRKLQEEQETTYFVPFSYRLTKRQLIQGLKVVFDEIKQDHDLLHEFTSVGGNKLCPDKVLIWFSTTPHIKKLSKFRWARDHFTLFNVENETQFNHVVTEVMDPDNVG